MDDVPDIEEVQLDLVFDYAEDFAESTKIYHTSEKNVQSESVVTTTPSRYRSRSYSGKELMTGENIDLKKNEELEICSESAKQMFSWGEELIDILTKKRIEGIDNSQLEFDSIYKGKSNEIEDGDTIENSKKDVIKFVKVCSTDKANKNLDKVDTILKISPNNIDTEIPEDEEHNDISTRKRLRAIDNSPLEIDPISKRIKCEIKDAANTKLVDIYNRKSFSSSDHSISQDKNLHASDFAQNCNDTESNKGNKLKAYLKDQSQLSLLLNSSPAHSTPVTEQSPLVNDSPHSDFSLPNSYSFESAAESDSLSFQDSDWEIIDNDNIGEIEELKSEPDLILYSPRTSSDTEQDIGYEKSSKDNYIFDLFGAEN